MFYLKNQRLTLFNDTNDKLDGDRNLKFISDDILPDVARLKNQENYSPCRMYFIRDGIVDSLIE